MASLNYDWRDPSLPIGALDSGLGGLSVLREIRKALPLEDLLFACDCGKAPWGDRPGSWIEDRVMKIAGFLTAHRVKAIVVACNTATSAAIDRLRSEFPFPVIGIEPAVKPAVRMTKDGVVGVLATTRTITSNRLESLIERFAGNDRVIPVACPGLMEQVEAGEFHTTKTRRIIEKYVGPLIDQGADTLVLGCTHYPFLADEIQAVAGKDVVIIDPSPAVARFLVQRLTEEGSLAPPFPGSGARGIRMTAQRRFRSSGLLKSVWKALKMPGRLSGMLFRRNRQKLLLLVSVALLCQPL